jgi:hypothetical protein
MMINHVGVTSVADNANRRIHFNALTLILSNKISVTRFTTTFRQKISTSNIHSLIGPVVKCLFPTDGLVVRVTGMY